MKHVICKAIVIVKLVIAALNSYNDITDLD